MNIWLTTRLQPCYFKQAVLNTKRWRGISRLTKDGKTSPRHRVVIDSSGSLAARPGGPIRHCFCWTHMAEANLIGRLHPVICNFHFSPFEASEQPSHLSFRNLFSLLALQEIPESSCELGDASDCLHIISLPLTTVSASLRTSSIVLRKSDTCMAWLKRQSLTSRTCPVDLNWNRISFQMTLPSECRKPCPTNVLPGRIDIQ